MQPTAVLKTPKGFTLIEVLSVVVIIGILAAVAIPSYKATMDRSRQKAAEAAIAEVKSRLTLGYARFRLENSGTDPSTITIQNIVDLVGTDELPASSNGLVPNMGGFTVTMSGHGGNEATITVTKVKDVDVSMPADIDNKWKIPQ